MTDEREHRRGLLLGLTLAEVLLLLLFLILLALGHRITNLEKKLKVATGTGPGVVNVSPNITGTSDITITKLVTKLLTETEKFHPNDPPAALINALGELHKLKLNAGQLASLVEALNSARTVAPQNPVGVLTRASKFASDIGLRPDETPGLVRAVQRARGIDPENPSAVIQKGLDLIPKGPRPGPATTPAGHSWPPIIVLSEAEGNYFPSGSAELSDSFSNILKGRVTQRLREILNTYKDVNVIEVIGHTDEQPIAGHVSNLDRTLVPYLNDQSPSTTIIPADNAGLGLARAASVVRVLRQDENLDGLRILPLSAGQTITLGDSLETNRRPLRNEQRRRIEIRVRRSDRSETSEPSHKSNGARGISGTPEPGPNMTSTVVSVKSLSPTIDKPTPPESPPQSDTDWKKNAFNQPN